MLLTIHSDRAVRGSRAFGSLPCSQCRRENWRMIDRKGGQGAGPAYRPRSSLCRPEACSQSERAGSYLKETQQTTSVLDVKTTETKLPDQGFILHINL